MIILAFIIMLTGQPAEVPAPDYHKVYHKRTAKARVVQSCHASWYGERFRGRATASGEIFNPDELTAAHRTLPLGTVVVVRSGDKQVKVEITDRGPYADTARRCIDLSRAAFEKLAPTGAGTVSVQLEKA